MAFNPVNESLRPTTKIVRPPVFKPYGKPGTIITAHQWAALQAKEEVEHSNKELKPFPENVTPLGEKIEYYIEIWKTGTEEKIASVVRTADIKNLARLILSKQKYSITYIKRSEDGKVLWDKPYIM